MVYQNKLVACLKVAGQILRESGDTVTLPFGSEYSILIKNLNSVRVQVKVSVDNKDATEGTWLVINPNSSIELERFISNGNLQSGNRFKFIERTRAVEKHRGIQADDGLIRIEYQTEKKLVIKDVEITRYHYNDNWYDWPYYWPKPYVPPCSPWVPRWADTVTCGSLASTPTVGIFNSSVGSGFMKSTEAPVITAAMCCSAPPPNDAGITVPGSHSDQQFHHVSGFDTYEQSQVLVLKLRGEVKGQRVVNVVTVKTKSNCVTCGKSSKSNADFCSRCGTALNIA